MSLPLLQKNKYQIIQIGENYNINAVTKQTETLFAEGQHHLIYDCKKLEYIDSAILSNLVSLLKTAKQNSGSIGLIVNQDIKKIIGDSLVHSIFALYNAVEEIK